MVISANGRPANTAKALACMKVKLADELAIANFGELDLLTDFFSCSYL